MSGERDFPVVGIAVGDADALMRFLRAVPRDSGMAFVVAWHGGEFDEPPPSAIVTDWSLLEIVEVEGRTALRADSLYLGRHGQRLSLVGHELYAAAAETTAAMPADYLLRAIADEKRESAVAAILPGRGSDGTLGARAVRQHGGLVAVVQPDPGADDMAASVIRAGLADIVSPCARLPLEILAVASTLHGKKYPTAGEFDIAALAAGLRLEDFAPAGVLIDSGGEILYLWGRTGTYLEAAPGGPDWNIATMARAGLRDAVARALPAAWKNDRTVSYRRVYLAGAAPQTIDLVARRVLAPALPFPIAMLGFRPPQRARRIASRSRGG